MNIFLVCGYGIPERLEVDQKYLTYLHLVFNTIFSHARGQEAAIIVCGGPTSCMKPYAGTEAQAISGYLQKLMHRPETRDNTGNWRLFMEDESLSTLENLTFAAAIIKAEELRGAITVFCEATRKGRVQTLAEKIFPSMSVDVFAVDFDTSMNRYLEPTDIQKREAAEIEGALWALENPEHMKAHHALFERKLTLLRELDAKGLTHAEAVREWYKIAPQWIAELMPDHPMLKKQG